MKTDVEQYDVTLAANLAAVRHLAKMLLADRIAELPPHEAAVFTKGLTPNERPSTEAGIAEARQVVANIVREAEELAVELREVRTAYRKRQAEKHQT